MAVWVADESVVPWSAGTMLLCTPHQTNMNMKSSLKAIRLRNGME